MLSDQLSDFRFVDLITYVQSVCFQTVKSLTLPYRWGRLNHLKVSIMRLQQFCKQQFFFYGAYWSNMRHLH